MKNNKGVTLTMLVIIIIVLFIITGISVDTGVEFMNDVRVSRIVANMELVQAKVEIIYEEYQFQGENSEIDVLVGQKVNGNDIFRKISDDKTISENDRKLFENDNNLWYQWNASVLEEQGLDKNMLDNPENDVFWVNYATSEIIYSRGTVIDGVTYFSKDALETVLAR